MDKFKLKEHARNVRRSVLGMVHQAGSSHVGSALSTVEMLVYLYAEHFKSNAPSDVRNQFRERFLLSKGHACTAVYATLAEFGYVEHAQLETYAQNGSAFMAHVSSAVPGVEFSTGSLGHAFPVALGMARAARYAGRPNGVHVLLSDGELNEGSNWEAFMLAPQWKLSNLHVLIDRNGLQGLGPTASIVHIGALEEQLKLLGWECVTVDGHDFMAIDTAYRSFAKHDAPKCIIADTVKGKGVSFMENSVAWHYKSPNAAEYAAALKELEASNA